MAYFRIISGMRGCYSDSNSNYVIECETPADLHKEIASELDRQTDTGEEDSTVEPCSPEEAESLFRVYTNERRPYLPTCAASWQDGHMGVLVSASDREEFELQQEESF